MARIRVDSSGIAEMRMSMEQQAQTMQRVEQAVGQVLANLDVKISSTDNIKQSLSSLKKSASKGREALFDMSGALTRVNDEFLSTDHAISEQARDIDYLMDSILADDFVKLVEGAGTIIIGESIKDLNSAFGITEQGYTTIRSAMEAIEKSLKDWATLPNACKEKESICNYLQGNDYTTFFGKYGFSAIFINSVKSGDAFIYGIKNWKETLMAIFTGASSGGNMGEAFMNNPDECKAILRKLIDQMSGTEYLDILSDDQEKYMGIVEELAKMTGCDDAADLIEQITGFVGDAEVADKLLKDYSANIAMLESIKTLVPNGTVLGKTIDSLIFDYQNQTKSILFGELKSAAEKGIVNMADYALGLEIGKVDLVIQTVLGDVPELKAMDTVIYTSNMRTSAIMSFRNAAEKIASGNFSDADLTAYKDSFNLAKSLTLEQYQGMLSYYESGSKQADYLRSEIEKMKNSTYDHFEYASSFK